MAPLCWVSTKERRAAKRRPYARAAYSVVGAAFGRPQFFARRNNMVKARRPQLEQQAKTFAVPGPSGPKGEGTTTHVLPAGTILSAEEAGRNGVLVPLPPWAKEPAAGAAELSFYESIPFCLPKKEPKMPRGLAPRSARTPVARPRTPVTGDASRQSSRASGAGGAVDCPRFRAATAGRDFGRTPGRLDEKGAPGACSRRGWFEFGGRRNAAPTPNLWSFAGG